MKIRLVIVKLPESESCGGARPASEALHAEDSGEQKLVLGLGMAVLAVEQLVAAEMGRAAARGAFT